MIPSGATFEAYVTVYVGEFSSYEEAKKEAAACWKDGEVVHTDIEEVLFVDENQ